MVSVVGKAGPDLEERGGEMRLDLLRAFPARRRDNQSRGVTDAECTARENRIRVVSRSGGEFTFPWQAYLDCFETGSWRAPIFRDMIMRDISTFAPGCVALDIGCGRGFDDSAELQVSLAQGVAHYIGVEPDTSVPAPECCDEFYPQLLEVSPIKTESVDVAFAIFVVEHLTQPEAFFGAVYRVLKPGGVFWAATVDARSPFAYASQIMERTGLKDRYLDRMFGQREERHRNYATVYSANTPKRLMQLSHRFASCEVASLHCVGITDKMLPRAIHPIAHALDRATLNRGWPGANLVVRMVK
jgi:SAM-dependent methyltransferase